MGFWSWVLVVAVLGVLALGVFALLALRLWRKTKALLAQVAQLTQALDSAALDRQPTAGTAARPDVDRDGAYGSEATGDEPAEAEWFAAARRGGASVTHP